MEPWDFLIKLLGLSIFMDHKHPYILPCKVNMITLSEGGSSEKPSRASYKRASQLGGEQEVGQGEAHQAGELHLLQSWRARLED